MPAPADRRLRLRHTATQLPRLLLPTLLLLLLLGLAHVLASAPEAAAGEGAVLVLDDTSYRATLAAKNLLLVSFCARWSRPCKVLQPEFDAAADALASSGFPGVMAQLSTEENTQSARAAGVAAYPSLKLFRRGVEQDTCKVVTFLTACKRSFSRTASSLCRRWRAHGGCPGCLHGAVRAPAALAPLPDPEQLTGSCHPRSHLSAKPPRPPPPPQRLQDSAVLNLSSASFDQALSDHAVVFVCFYAPVRDHLGWTISSHTSRTRAPSGASTARACCQSSRRRPPRWRRSTQGRAPSRWPKSTQLS